jgi:hypothetical protein
VFYCSRGRFMKRLPIAQRRAADAETAAPVLNARSLPYMVVNEVRLGPAIVGDEDFPFPLPRLHLPRRLFFGLGAVKISRSCVVSANAEIALRHRAFKI